MRTLLSTIFTLSLTSVATAQQCGSNFVEPFTSGNVGAWQYGGPNEGVLSSGGFSGAYFRTTDVDTFAPQFQTSGPSVFTGDYVAAQVTSLGVDFRSFDIDFPSSCNRPLSLILDDDNGTPVNFSDDVFVYYVGPDNVPCLDGLWHSYTVDVPSQSPTLPAGWEVDPNWAGSPDAAWTRVMGHVTGVRWFWGNPTFFFIFQQWTVGADNPRISFAGGASAYCLSQKNSANCQPRIDASGVASASSPAPFDVTCSDVVNQKLGLMFYGFARQSTPYHGGTLCVVPPTRRTPVQLSNGSPAGNDCTGSFSYDLNPRIQSGADPSLTVGADVYLQYWSRDPSSVATTNLSNALRTRICP
jgi:hypothetical protein